MQVIYCGTIVTDEGKERRVNIDFEPFKPINTSLYLCDNKFHTEARREARLTPPNPTPIACSKRTDARARAAERPPLGCLRRRCTSSSRTTTSLASW